MEQNRKPRAATRPGGAATPANAPLTPSEQVFVETYIVDLNGVRAYQVAFPAAGYPAAKVGASRLLSRANVRAEIATARRAQQRRTRITADKALREIARVAFADIFDLFDHEGHARPVGQIPIETRRAVASVKITRERTTRRAIRNGKTKTTVTVRENVIEYKLWPKTDALGKLTNYLGLNTSIPPIEAFLGALPLTLAGQVRRALAENAPTAVQ